MKIDCNYIVHEREDYIRQIDVYKIGRSGNIFSRMKGYPKGSMLVFMSSSPHMELVETKLIQIFSSLFIQRLDRGREYFQGDLETMKKIMMDTISYYNKIIECLNIPNEVLNITQEHKDEYKDFRDKYITKDDNSYIQWSDLKITFNKWLKSINKPILNGKGFKELKKYFETKLGKFVNTRRNNDNLHGFTGWKLKSFDIYLLS